MADEVGNAQVAVFPVFTGFRSKVAAEIGGSGKQAGKAFSDAFKTSSAATAPNLTKFKAEVRSAAAALSKARLAQQDQAGRVRVAETRLAEAVAKSGAGSSRAAAAEESLAAARRRLGVADEKVTAEAGRLRAAQEAVTKATNEASAAATRATGSAGRFGEAWNALRSRLTGASDGVRRDVNRAERLARSGGSGVGNAFASGFRGVVAGAAALGVGVALAGVVRDAYDEAVESQKVAAITTNALKQTGAQAWITADQIGDLATSISNKTGVDDEAVQSSANLLLTFKAVRNEVGAGNQIFNRATKATQDLSAAGFGSAEGAAKMLGKALNDPVKGMSALSRAGVTFTEGQKAQVKALVKSGDTLRAQKIILDEVESQVGGAAAASATAGEKLATAWANSKEALGTAFLPVLEKVMGAITRLLTENGPQIEEFGSVFAAGFDNALKALGPLLPEFASLFAGISKATGPLLAQVGPVLVQILGTVSSVLGGVLAQVMPVVAQLAASLLPLLAQTLSQIAPFVQQLVAAFLPLVPILGQLVASLLPPVAQIIAALVPVVAQLVTALTPVVGVIAELVAAILPPLVSIIAELVPPLAELVSTLIDALLPVLVELVPVFKAVIPVVAQIIVFVAKLVVGLVQFVVTLNNQVTGALRGLGMWLVAVARDFGTFVGQGIARVRDFAAQVGDRIRSVIQWFREVPARVKSAIGNTGNLLTGAGRALVNGFLSGIKASWSTLVGWVKNGMENLRGLWPFSPAKWGPFSGKGYVTHSGKALTDDWAASLSAGQSKVTAAASKLAASAQRPLTAAGGTPAPASTGSGVSTDMVDVLVQALVAVFEARGISILTLSDRLTEVQDRALEMA